MGGDPCNPSLSYTAVSLVVVVDPTRDGVGGRERERERVFCISSYAAV